MRTLLLDEIDSTNEEARRRAEAGETGPLWILAKRQTAGRGRRGRKWLAREGNFMGTLLLAPSPAPAQSAQHSFVAALAVAETLEECGCRALALKWPNDVLVHGAKISGILLESSASKAGAWLAIGIGINLAWAPEGMPYATTCLARESGRAAPSPQDVLGSLMRAFDRQFERWSVEGFAPVRAEWLARAKGVGEMIRVQMNNEEAEGVFQTIDASGALVLRTAAGERLISAGDVFFKGIKQ